ncbi:MAG: zeta toxin family protein [Ruminococcus sp.]|nr:zeta toxin family protein [Ruminococcus sp.]
MKTFTVIGGVNGVGKSSLSGVLSAESTELGIIIDTDKLGLKHGGDRIKGGKEAVGLINKCLERGLTFTQETTLSGVRTLKTIRRAKDLGYYIKLYYIGVDSCEESLSRIANRVRKGGHDIPDEDVKRRFEKRFEDLCRVLPYCNEVKLFDNENGFEEVAAYQNGRLTPIGSRRPKWLCGLLEYFETGGSLK